MDKQDTKFVIVINENLPQGIAANTAAIIGMSLGKKLPEAVGRDVTDQSGSLHPGIVELPVPILKSSAETIQEIRNIIQKVEYSSLTAVDFTDLAQGCRTYDEYIEKMALASDDSLKYFGIGLCGPKKKINRLTGSLPLMR